MVKSATRGRAWRRDQRAWCIAAVLGYLRQRRRFEEVYHGRRGWWLAYERRLSLTETERLIVRSAADFTRYLQWEARKLRDNPQACGCQMCGNPRHSRFSRRLARLTLQEQIALQTGFDEP